MTTWTYDRLNRLVTQQSGGLLRVAGTVSEPATVRVQGQAAAVDASGVFVGGVQVAPGTTWFTVTATDASGNVTAQSYDVDQVGPAKTFTFDANGNMTSDRTRTFEWNGANRLVKARVGSSEIASFSYDGLGLRASKTVGGILHHYVNDGPHAAEERIGETGAVVRHIRTHRLDDWIGRQDTTGAAKLFVRDHLGSIVRETDAAGELILGREYDPWGRQGGMGANSSSVAYTGREWDPETELYYYRARYYSAEVGRFMTQDPIGFFGGTNLYVYADSEPIGTYDPSGLGPIKIITLCAKGYKVIRTVGFKRAVQAVRRGENVLAGSSKEAKRIARAASRAKTPTREAPHQPGYMPHYHPAPRTGAYVSTNLRRR